MNCRVKQYHNHLQKSSHSRIWATSTPSHKSYNTFQSVQACIEKAYILITGCLSLIINLRRTAAMVAPCSITSIIYWICPSALNYTEMIAVRDDGCESKLKVKTLHRTLLDVLLPCMGFRQVVCVGINQVDSEKSWACRTCRALPEYILVITVPTHFTNHAT